MTVLVRHATGADHGRGDAVIDDWWGGRSMRRMLPRLFFEHFADTSFVVEEDGDLVAFLIAFMSSAHPDEAYIHFVGVRPDRRSEGHARGLYHRFFALAVERGCRSVGCITAPINEGSIAFHDRWGSTSSPATPTSAAPRSTRPTTAPERTGSSSAGHCARSPTA